MRLDIRCPGLRSSAALRGHVHRLADAHLAKFGADVTTVAIHLADLNGPRRGVDKRVQIHVCGPRLGVRRLEVIGHDAYDAIQAAVRRMGRAVARRLDRARSLGARPRALSATP